MSSSITTWVWDKSPIHSPKQKLVLLALADCAGEGEQYITESTVIYIAKKTRVPADEVEKAIGHFVVKGILSTSSEWEEPRYLWSMYLLTKGK